MRLTKRRPKKPEKSRFPSRKGDGPGRKFHSPTGNAPPTTGSRGATGAETGRSDPKGGTAPGDPDKTDAAPSCESPALPPARRHPARYAARTETGLPTTGSPDERLKPTDRTTGRMTCRNAAAPKRRAGRLSGERRPARRYPDAAGTTSPFRPFSVRPSP